MRNFDECIKYNVNPYFISVTGLFVVSVKGDINATGCVY